MTVNALSPWCAEYHWSGHAAAPGAVVLPNCMATKATTSNTYGAGRGIERRRRGSLDGASSACTRWAYVVGWLIGG